MAVQSEGSTPSYTAETVGHAFVQQFYSVLHDKPDVAHRFFQDSSTMSRPGPDGSVETVTSMDGIKQLILSLDCQDFIIEILTADAQASYGNGVAVLVTGCLTGKDNVRRKFTELFFLAPQESGYFVYNNVFRFIDEESLLVVNSIEEKDVHESEPAASVIPIEEATIDPTIKVTPTVEDEIETISTSTDEHKPIVKDNAIPQVSDDSGHSVQAVSEPLSNGHVDVNAPKLSYVQTLLNNAKEGGRTVLVNKPTGGAKVPIKSTTKKTVQQARDASTPSPQQTAATSAPLATSETSVANGSKVSNGGKGFGADQSEGKGYSVYIGGLPYDASVEQVELEFKKFGRIRADGIQVRTNKGYCFGFVEYEDASGQQKALQVGKVSIGGKEATIELKRTGTKVVNGVSVYPSGRGGGYRNDGFRGRGNFSNGGGRPYARNDSGVRNGDGYGNKRNGDGYGNKRNGEFSSRSSSRNNGDGYVYQNGNGGRGARQGAPSK